LICFFARRYDEALKAFQTTLELDPGFTVALGLSGLVYTQMSEFDKAMDVMEREKRLSKSEDLQLKSWIGVACAKMGKKQKAQDALNTLRERSKTGYVHPSYFAWIHFSLGEIDEGFFWLDKAYEERDTDLAYLRVYPWFDGVRDDPRFLALLKKVGF
jgi:tetratricopeptide (TPR) repeat protein